MAASRCRLLCLAPFYPAGRDLPGLRAIAFPFGLCCVWGGSVCWQIATRRCTGKTRRLGHCDHAGTDRVESETSERGSVATKGDCPVPVPRFAIWSAGRPVLYQFGM